MLQTNSKTTVPVFTGKIPSLKPTPENVAEQQPQPAAAEVEIISDANDIKISNSDFIGHIFSDLPKNTYAAVCTKSGDPTKNGWQAKRADLYSNQLASTHNNYLNTSSFRIMDDGLFKVRKENFSVTHFLLLDDFGTKIAFDRLNDFKPSWLIETSPGNFQAGIIFKEPLKNATVVNQLQKAIIEAGLCDPGATGPTNRWARLPMGINGKVKYTDELARPFQCKLASFDPQMRYTEEEIVNGLKLTLSAKQPSQKEVVTKELIPYEIFMPKAALNPVLTKLKEHGLYKNSVSTGKHDITCPWLNEHTDAVDSGSAYFEPNDRFPLGGYCCQHSHREKYHIGALLEFLGLDDNEARNKPIIRVAQGEIHSIIDAVERVFMDANTIYQSGGLLVVIKTDPQTGQAEIMPINKDALTKQLSAQIIWEKYDGRAKSLVRCDPPTRHVAIFYNAQEYKYLPALRGIARQPYFREQDGQLVTDPGYDAISKRYGVFDAQAYSFPEPTREAAEAALELLNELLAEFYFPTEHDKSAALSAIFTAATRSSLNLAPGFHAGAPSSGSGKSYLCGVISQFATPGESQAVSYPTTSEEATKSMLSALLTGPAVIEFDDMATDWIPHGVINRMLTSETITDRILGVSKMATVSTRTLILGSGNNVGPIRDLSRRVLTIHLDTRSSTPATIQYKGSPIDQVKANRESYITAVLTIILAWQAAGKPKAKVENIVSYSGDWSNYCRHPLIWLGLPDPATTLLDQVKNDPDAEKLSDLMTEWYREFGSIPVTVRKVVDLAVNGSNTEALYDALAEFPIEEKGSFNRPKLGWLLKKNVDRIINGFEFRKAIADGRNAWRVVKADTIDPENEGPVMSDNERERVEFDKHLNKALCVGLYSRKK
ncbi:MAG: hypothetical protein RIR39_293 [Pseudomonadota bacterium]